MNQDLYLCYTSIDFEKAYDKVRHSKLIEILTSKKVDSRDKLILSHLYWNQIAKVRIDNQFSSDFETYKNRAR